MTANLELRAVTKRYGDFTAVDGISIEVPPGTVFGLLGPNGAGKTTTIRMIMDILAPDTGEVLLFGRSRRPDDADRIGYLPEERGLYRKMTVSEQLIFLAELHGLKRAEAARRTADWLGRVELADRAKAKLETLSKGMQQKVQLIGTILHDPEILILDEPFSGLDPINQGLFKELIADFKRRGKTILFSTHIMEQAEKLCDSICLVSKGRIVLAGDLAAIKRERGGSVFRLKVAGDAALVAGTAGVERFDPESGRLLLAAGASPAAVLRALAGVCDVLSFSSAEPDLETIFFEAVRDAN